MKKENEDQVTYYPKATYYIKAGPDARWSETTEKMFNFIAERNQKED